MKTVKLVRSSVVIAAIASAASMASSASGAVATFTADNHYALYSSTSGVLTFIGGNETGAGGNPGTYNWSLPETWQFDPGDTIFVAAWSDDSTAQGLLGQVDFGGGVIYTGDPAWRFVGTGTTRSDGSPWPTAGDVGAVVDNADVNHLWSDPWVYLNNAPSTSPWGMVPGIDAQAKWMWGNTSGVSNPLIGPPQGDYQVFRLAVPTPGVGALAAMGLLAGTRRRR